MARFTETEKIIAGSFSVPRVVSEPPTSYANFTPVVTSEHRSPQAAKADVNRLSSLLVDVQDVISFAKHRFLRPRMITMMKLRDNVNSNKSTLEVAGKSLDCLDEFIRLASENICASVCEWDRRKKYYTNIINLVSNQDCSSLNIKLSETSLRSFVDLVRKMEQLCSKIEKELKMTELQLTNMDEMSLAIRNVIQHFFIKVENTSGRVMKHFNEQYVEAYCLLESAEQDVNTFKSEWQKEGAELSSASPRLYTAQPPPKDENWTPPSCPRRKPVLKSAAAKSSGLEGPSSQMRMQPKGDDLNASHSKIDSFAQQLPSTVERKSRAVKDIVDRYTNLQLMARNEMNNMKDQQLFMKRNEIDLAKRSTV